MRFLYFHGRYSLNQWENRLVLAGYHIVNVTRPRHYRVTDPRIFVISYHPSRCVWFTIRIICKLAHRLRHFSEKRVQADGELPGGSSDWRTDGGDWVKQLRVKPRRLSRPHNIILFANTQIHTYLHTFIYYKH